MPDSTLRVNSAQLERARHPIDGYHVCGDAVIHAMTLPIAHDLVEAIFHHVLQPLVHFALAPEESLPVLYPLEITHRHAACVSKNVWNDENTLVLDDEISMGCRRTIRAFAKNSTFHSFCVLGGYLVLGGCRNKYVARTEEYFLRAYFFPAARKFRQRLALSVHPIDNLGNVETLVVIKPTVNISQSD